MNFYIRCAAVSFASFAFLVSSNLMASKPAPADLAAVAAASAPAATLAAAGQPRTN